MEGAIRKSRGDLTLGWIILPVPVYSTEGSLGGSGSTHSTSSSSSATNAFFLCFFYAFFFILLFAALRIQVALRYGRGGITFASAELCFENDYIYIYSLSLLFT